MANAPLLYDEQKTVLNDIRRQIADIMKQVDDFVNKVEIRILEEERGLDEKIKQYATLQAEKQKLVETRITIEQERKILDKEKEGNRLKQISLTQKEEELNEKLKKVQAIIN